MKINLLILFSIFLSFVFVSSASAYDKCSVYSSLSDLSVDLPNSGDQLHCTVSPTSQEFRVYEISFCTQEPDVGDTSTCEQVFTSSSGTDVEITSSSSTNVASNVSISTGEYTYAVIVLNDAFSLQIDYDWGFSVSDASGNQGRYCYYYGNGDNMKCNSIKVSSSSLDLEVDAVNTLYSDSGIEDMAVSADGFLSIGSQTFNIRMIDSSGDLAVFTHISNNITNADKIMIIIPFLTAKTISSNSKTITLGFTSTDAGLLSVRNSYSTIQVENGFLSGFGFTASVE